MSPMRAASEAMRSRLASMGAAQAVLLTAALYIATGRLGLLLAIPPGYATAVWPPSGIALAAVLLLGRRVWPGILLGSVAVNAPTAFDPSGALAIARSLVVPLAIGAGATAQAVVGASLVLRYASGAGSPGLDRQIPRFLALAGPVSCLINATSSICVLVAVGSLALRDAPFNWCTWWVGDSIGALIFAPLALLWCKYRLREELRRKLSVSIPLCLTFSLAVLLYASVRDWELDRLQLDFERRSFVLEQAVERSLQADFEAIDSLGNFYEVSEHVGKREFVELARRALDRHPGIGALAWVPHVPDALRADPLDASAGLDGGELELAPVDASAALAPVEFVEPLEGHEWMVGFDLAAEPAPREALVRAQETGSTSATPPVWYGPEIEDRKTVLVFQPVFARRSPGASEGAERSGLRGYVVATFQVADALAAALRGVETTGLGAQVWDATHAGRDEFLWHFGAAAVAPAVAPAAALEPSRAASPSLAAARIQPSSRAALVDRVVDVPIAGRLWQLRFLPVMSELAGQRPWQTWSVLAGSLLFTGLLGAFLLLMTGQTAATEELNRRLEHISRIDPLTELLNRRGLEAELSIEISRARRTGAPLAAVLLDCDDFKRVNDTFGHAAGDVVLRELAGRLRGSVRPSDKLARIGGDEFLVLLPETRLAEAAHVAERMRLAVADTPLRVSSGPVRLTASLGVELVGGETMSIEEVLVRTQHALQQSKRHGKNRIWSRAKGVRRGESAAQETFAALERGGFRAVRQAIVQVRSENVAGWEFLSRGPAGHLELPADFFRAAQEHNVLTTVDLQCLKTCLRASRELPAGTRCHVNLFPSTLLDTPHERLVELFPVGPDAPRYCVEISEQQFIGDPAYLGASVRALKAAGVQVAIDDVGFGRSSFESLILLEPDVIKIDQRFVQGVGSDPAKEHSLRRLVEAVAAIGGELVAEGIESRRDLERLCAIGVPLGQGYLFGRPA